MPYIACGLFAYVGYALLVAVTHWTIYRWFRAPAYNRMCIGRPGIGRLAFEVVLTLWMPVGMTKELYKEFKKGF